MDNKRNGRRHAVVIVAFGFLALSSQPASAELSFSTGVDYSSGRYGTTEETRITYLPFTVKYESDSYLLRLTVPYLSIDAPAGGQIVAIGPDGQPIRESTGKRETNRGLGDVVAAAGYTVVQRGSTLLEVIGKVKFATADENKGLGTGENDYSLQLDWAQKFDATTLIATVGYRVYGDPPGVNFDNAFFASLGGVYKFTAETSGGLIYDFRQHIVDGTPSQRDVTAFLTYKSGKSVKIQGYVSAGLSDASPDWGVGVIAAFLF